MGTEVFVECEVRDGMFSDEAVVEVGNKSFVVAKSNVRTGVGQQSAVKARLIKNDQGEWIVLPTDYSESIPKSAGKIVQ